MTANQWRALLFVSCCGSCTGPLAGSPVYDPARSNTVAAADHANCYTYALDRTDRILDPGDLAHLPRFSRGDVARDALTARATQDGLRPVADPDDCGDPCWAVAAATSPLDYHWYRRDADGVWSHKQGLGFATTTDRSNKTIRDPRFANRGRYTEFVGYFCACKES